MSEAKSGLITSKRQEDIVLSSSSPSSGGNYSPSVEDLSSNLPRSTKDKGKFYLKDELLDTETDTNNPEKIPQKTKRLSKMKKSDENSDSDGDDILFICETPARPMNRKLSSVRKFQEAEADLDTDEDRTQANKSIKKSKKRKRISNSSGISSEDNVLTTASDKPAPSPPKSVNVETKKPSTNPFAKMEKFDDVEHAMEVMFAGLGDSPDCSKSKLSKKTPPKPKSSFVSENSAVLKSTSPGTNLKIKDRKAIDKKKAHLYGSRLSEQDKLLNKYDGPFVRVNGDIAKPDWSNVINSNLDPLSSKMTKSKGINDLDQIQKSDSFGPTSTLAPDYDAKKSDSSWICVFCKKTSHYQKLGDLYGPYFISSDVKSPSPSKSKKLPCEKDLAAKFIIGGDTRGKSNKKKRKSWETPREQTEVWFHEDCICWMPQISLIGSRIIGLEEAVSGASDAFCACCKLPGATLACLKGPCKEFAHFICAVNNKWQIDEENFEAICSIHA